MKNSLSYKLYLSLLKYGSILNVLGTVKSKDIILCYHDLGSNVWDFSVDKSEFEVQMNLLQKKYNIVGISDLLNKQHKNTKPNAAVSFDDGYESVYKIAYPVLKKIGAAGTVFVIGSSKSNPNMSLKLLSIEQIKELHKNGWEIGWHTNKHVSSVNESKDSLYMDLKISKSAYEKKLGLKLNYFAYPFGKYNKNVETIVKKAGFLGAFTVDGDAIDLAKGIYRLSRVTVSKSITKQHFENLITPIGLKINHFFTNGWKYADYFLKR
ncbi:MAG: polysaccharide deacetylase family protein [Parachlamydiales bacterium]|jgi:peptidoglycan/xylan/chitin deacetylase (PgdA/CDA1 family)